MIRVIRVRYKIGVWFSYPVDQKFNTVELARDYYKDYYNDCYKDYYSVEKILLDYEEY